MKISVICCDTIDENRSVKARGTGRVAAPNVGKVYRNHLFDIACLISPVPLPLFVNRFGPMSLYLEALKDCQYFFLLFRITPIFHTALEFLSAAPLCPCCNEACALENYTWIQMECF